MKEEAHWWVWWAFSIPIKPHFMKEKIIPF
jgi:hypothetical protein